MYEVGPKKTLWWVCGQHLGGVMMIKRDTTKYPTYICWAEWEYMEKYIGVRYVGMR